MNEKQEWRNWSGYLAAGTYEPTHEREYYAIRNSAALIDVSPLYKYDIQGLDAERLVNKIVTRDVKKCGLGQIMYSPWCDENGHMIDDGTIWRLAENHFRITAAEPNLRWFQDCGFGLDCQVRDVSNNLAALALQGPNSHKILQEVVKDVEVGGIGYYRLAPATIDGIPLTITRTGFTGDLGFELWFLPEHAEEIWDLLMEAGQWYGLLPAGMVALDIARIEAGLLLIEVDYLPANKALIDSRKSTPFEAGLDWTVALDKGVFVGRRALEAEAIRGSHWALVGLEIDWPVLESLFATHDLPPLVAGRASREAVPVYNDNGRQIGQATSRTFSPVLKKYIALATIESEFAHEGFDLSIEVTVEYTRQQCPARVVSTPFYDPTHKRK
ncbi:MAG: aminomethyltransferase family protein [Chloroflexota bacterium]